MHTFSDFELTDACHFKEFAEACNGTFELSQFHRINDTTISWNASTYGINVFGVTPINVLITLDFDSNDNEYFIMDVKFGISNTSVYCQKFHSPIIALNYLNRCMDVIKARKKKADSIWEEYGF